jgi:hypothetical protein
VRVLEIPIYRCTEEQHQKEEDERFEAWIEPLETAFYLDGRMPERVQRWENYRSELRSRMVIPWDFNEIIGWIRLYTWPGNIRAYLFSTRERITRVMRRKTFETRRANFIEMRVYPNETNHEILVGLKARILAGITEHRRLHRAFVDTGVLDTLGPHIDCDRIGHNLRPVWSQANAQANTVHMDGCRKQFGDPELN